MLESIESKLTAHNTKSIVTLHDAFFHGSIEQAIRMLNTSSDIHTFEFGWSVLHYAALRDNPAFVQIILDRGFDPNIRNETNYTPLHIASLMGHTRTIQALIATGADIDAMEEHGETPLHLAAMHARSRAVVTLLSLGASMDVRDYDGHTPYEQARLEGAHVVCDIMQKARTILENTNHQMSSPEELFEKLSPLSHHIGGIKKIEKASA